jgi:site-specific DNA-methyltransferase (adenine-specific)
MTSLVADKNKHQWFTPTWAGQVLFREHFSELGADDLVVEPTCGIGTFLKAIPDDVPALGVEMDPVLADIARRSTGRAVLTGDFTKVDLGERRPTAVVGNPPFDMDVIDAIFDRCFDLLPYGGKVGFVMPAYAFQTASRVVRYARRWSLDQDMIPRNLFKNMEKPLCFAVLTKDSVGRMRGFSLYRELHDVNSMKSWVVDELNTGRAPWKGVVMRAMEEMGGRARLQDIYEMVAPKRPTGNNWWRAKVRQTLTRSGAFERVGEGEYRIADDQKIAA